MTHKSENLRRFSSRHAWDKSRAKTNGGIGDSYNRITTAGAQNCRILCLMERCGSDLKPELF